MPIGLEAGLRLAPNATWNDDFKAHDLTGSQVFKVAKKQLVEETSSSRDRYATGLAVPWWLDALEPSYQVEMGPTCQGNDFTLAA